MSENAEKQEPLEKDADRGRRQFVKLGVGSMCVACGGAAVLGYDFLSPNILYEPSPIFNAGKPDGYAAGSVTQDLAAGVYIVHGPEGLYAMSAVCTHLGCLTAWRPELDMVACPCHGSKFRRDGTKIEGPAPRPLSWLRAWVSDEGDLLIDRSEFLTQKQYVRT